MRARCGDDAISRTCTTVSTHADCKNPDVAVSLPSPRWNERLQTFGFRRLERDPPLANRRYRPRISGSATSATDSLCPTRAPSHTRATPGRGVVAVAGVSAVAYSV